MSSRKSNHESPANSNRPMLRYRLRTLLIVLALVPMLVGGMVNLALHAARAKEHARNRSCNNSLRQWTGVLPQKITKWP
jgi:hypothetical protein